MDFLQFQFYLYVINTDILIYLPSMVRSTGTRLTKPQIMGCIRSIDADGDGTIDLPELYAAMEVISRSNVY